MKLTHRLISLLLVAVLLCGAVSALASCGTYNNTEGEVIICLDASQAPLTVENFLKLVDAGFYNGLTMHRIIDGFMIQGGDPKGDGTGGAAEKITGEFLSNGVLNTLWHERGVISMARGNDVNSASSQFFIMTDAADHLNGSYAAFGWVVGDGMTVVDAIAGGSYDFLDSNGSVPAKQQPRIVSIARTTYTGEDASDAYTYVKITFAYHTEQ